MSGPSTQRLAFIDALKAVAAQLIVLHHLAFYGPMSDRVRPYAPDVLGWFADHARMAVQVFLVIGGFMAARSLAPQGRLLDGRPAALVAKRYLRLVAPYAVVVVAAILAAHVAGGWMQHESISAPPTASQFIAHLLLLQDVLGFESLSAGLWYVAIDFQLYVALLALLWVTRRADPRVGMGLVVACGIASLAHFNRDAAWDVWALYFCGAYAFGAVAYWFSQRVVGVSFAMVLAVGTLIALALDFRIRIAVALAVAVLFVVASRSGVLARWPASPAVAYLGRIAYSVFLAHFPVCLVINAAWVRFGSDGPWVNALGLAVAWAASVAAGALLHRWVESRTGALLGALSRVSPAAGRSP